MTQWEVRAMSGGDVVTKHGWLASMDTAWVKRTIQANESDSSPISIAIWAHNHKE